MLQFDPNDPYPRAETAFSYHEAQRHAGEVDAWLGLRVLQLESELSAEAARSTDIPVDQELWVDLPAQALLTPYTELRAILDRIQPPDGSTVVDLGAGYGRLGFVMARHCPSARFVGYELVRRRVDEANARLTAHGCANAEMILADLSAPGFRPRPAEFYFIYDFGSRTAIAKTLEDLRHIARSHSIMVIGRGRASRDAIERSQPWLSQIRPPEHYPHYSIYRS